MICSKIFLIHLGDESGTQDLSDVYDSCDYVWRTFCSNKYFENPKVSCIPIGYKSGTLLKNEKKNRNFKWAFIGTQHKSSRHDMNFQLAKIKPNIVNRTDKFDDEKKRKLIHLICRVKGEKVYDEKKEVGDMKIKLDDADLVINEVLGKMRVEGINVL